MRRGWKKVAEQADTPAFSVTDIVPRIVDALSEDWREEVGAEQLRSLREFLKDTGQYALFPEQRREALERMRREAAGKALGLTLVECADRAAARGLSGEEALVAAAQSTLALHVTRGVRSMEEHYLRKSTVPRAANVRQKAEGAAAGCALDALARHLTGQQGSAAPHRVAKKDGVDEGVTL
jgi:hypothetical protein